MFELKQAVDAEETDAGGKKKQKSKKPKGNALRLAARSLFRGESDLGPKFRKLRARRGAPKAIRRGAPKAIKGTARYLGCLVHRILTHGQAWVDRGTSRFQRLGEPSGGKTLAIANTRCAHSDTPWRHNCPSHRASRVVRRESEFDVSRFCSYPKKMAAWGPTRSFRPNRLDGFDRSLAVGAVANVLSRYSIETQPELRVEPILFPVYSCDCWPVHTLVQ